jgi:hypothetical protein
MQRGLNGRFCATGVNSDVDGHWPPSFLETKLFHHRVGTALRIFHLALIWVGGGREENVSCRVVFRKLKPRGHNVHRDHSGRAEGFCDRHAKEAHRTSPPHGNGLGGAEVGDVGDCVDRDGEGFDLHSESAGGKQTRGIGGRTIAASSRVMLSGMRYETPRRETVVATQGSVVGRRSGEFYTVLRNEGHSGQGVRTDVPAELGSLVNEGGNGQGHNSPHTLPLLHSWQRLQTAPGSRATLSPGFKWATFAPTLSGVSDVTPHNAD